MPGQHLLLCILLSILELPIEASHFRGGTISWKPTGNGNEVRFTFKLGWAYGGGPGCTPSNIGQLVTGQNSSYWKCTNGCIGTVKLANTNYICTGASVSDDWEQGENTFTYTFPRIGPYTVEIQYSCNATIRIPVVDDDGDTVRCRWSTGSECVSICNALPSATIDSNTCTISFPANHASNGTYAVAISVEDYPKSTIIIGSKVYTTDINECASNPCENQASCNDLVNFFNCTCLPGFTDINECASNPCENQATFNNYVNFFNCTCLPGFTGYRCQKDINECASNPCENQATCNDLVNFFNCTCLPGFTGDRCQKDINECEIGPCIFLFDCEDRINEYHCNLIEWKLALIISTSVMLSLIVISVFTYSFKRKTYKDKDHTWLANFVDIHKPDVQSRVL
uniref:EGF-like domain-containing protein n=1 Tax=Magallana gigas TaxID=29159 RepID=A0A8W8M2J1_MAGGI